ncbi:MAG: bifunctional adenosylcobinamide kinase/adenosylcobinamide-phosphate guanylyltransferase [Candidatus Rokubacteria bacterium]|nr:bifunctional adenosylcobinamide kinase/adenosylcobinamide-phosphate guanylyltransferase [Candidatus Rokubacteria bacterium]
MATRFVLGGARSGKSRFAIAAASGAAARPSDATGVVFIATARPCDPDMAARIARHRAERPRDWITIEEPFDLVERLDALPPGTHAVIVDCLTLWVANLQLRGDPEDAIVERARALARRIRACPADLTVVSNEVGEGVHPETRAGLTFRDLLGQVNQEVAAASETVVLMVAGLPLTVKSPVLDARPAP